MKDIALAIISILLSIFVFFVLVALGWFIVWKLFLSRFKFVRELLGGMSQSSSVNDLRNGRSRVKKARRD